MMTDNQRENVYLQIGITVVTLATAFPLTFLYDIYGLALAYAIGFILNNAVEMMFLWWREGLFPITVHHLRIIGVGVPLLAVLYTLNALFAAWIGALVAFVAIPAFVAGSFRWCFTAGEREAIGKWKEETVTNLRKRI